LLACVGPTLVGCENREIQFKTAVSFQNSVVNFPILATVRLTKRGSDLLFLNLETGEKSVFSRPDVAFNSVQSIPGDTGWFILTGRMGKVYIIAKYNIIEHKYLLIFSSESTLIFPFQIRNKPCALRPDLRTNKGLYNFFAYCNNTLINGENKIQIVTHVSISDSQVSFFNNSNFSYHTVGVATDTREATINNFDAPTRDGQWMFYFRDILYVVERAEPNNAYSMTSSGFLPYSGNIMSTIRNAKIEGYKDIIYFEDEVFVTAYPDDYNGKINVELFSKSSDLVKTFSISILEQ